MSKKKIYNRKFNKEEIEYIQRFLKEIYPQEEDCFVKIFSKSTKEYKFYNIHSLNEVGKLKNILNSFGKNDLMISSNTFKSMDKATESNLFSINTICVDIDYKRKDYLKNLPPENIIKLLEMDYIGSLIPKPNYIEYGNQIRLIYVLNEPAYIPKGKIAVRTLCNRISEYFAQVLDEYGAEKQKSEKFIRVPYGTNTKTLDSIKLIHYEDYKYTLNEIQEMWLDEIPVWYEKWKSKKKTNTKKSKPFNALEFNQKRLSDFRRIQYYLNQNDIKDFRSRLCFLYHNYSLLAYKDNPKIQGDISQIAINDMVEFNNNFKYPLKSNKIISDTKFLRNKQYKYSNETLMEFLELTNELCDFLYLESIFEVKSKEVINKEYYEDNKQELLKLSKQYYEHNKKRISEYKKEKYQEKLKQQGKLSKKEEKEIMKAKIKDLLAEGLLQKQIAIELNLSLPTIKRYVSIIKKEGL